MKLGRLVQAASVFGVALFMMASSARALPIFYTTTDTGAFTNTGFGGATSTLTFTGNPSGSTGVPSNVDLGDLELVCASCSITSAGTAGATYAAGQTIDLIVNDMTDGGVGEFVGTLTSGGTVFSNSSPLVISWGAFTIESGSFGGTTFGIYTPTPLAAANSGSPAGDTTIQGFVNSSSVPEPATLSLIGGGLLGLGLVQRKRSARK